MNNIFKRLLKIGQAEAHSAVDQLESPIKLTEQGIRDMKENLDKSLQSLAQVKALSIRARNDIETYSDAAEDYERKALMLLKKAQAGEMTPAEADRLAGEALVKKEASLNQANRSKAEKAKFDQSISELDQNIKTIKINQQGFFRQQYMARMKDREYPLYFDYFIKFLREEINLDDNQSKEHDTE